MAAPILPHRVWAVIAFLFVIGVLPFYTRLVRSARNLSNDLEVPDGEPRSVFGAPEMGTARQIFLAEVSCDGVESRVPAARSVVRLDATLGCAVESAARNNPGAFVYVRHSCVVDLASLDRSSAIVQSIFQRYDNVVVWHETLDVLLRNTVFDEFYHSGVESISKFFVRHASVVSRLAILWKYGGVYVDADSVVEKELVPATSVFGALNSANDTNGLNSEVVDENLAERCLAEMRESSSQLSDLMSEKCDWLTVYPPRVNFAVPYVQWRNFFASRPGAKNDEMEATRVAYAVHLLTSLVARDREDAKSVLDSKTLLQKQHCPLAHMDLDALELQDAFP